MRFSSPMVVIVILENSGFEVTPTDILSMLKFRDLKRCVTLNNTPVLFYTKIDIIPNIVITKTVISYPLTEFQGLQMAKHLLLDLSVCQLQL